MNKKFILGMVLSASLMTACSNSEPKNQGRFTVDSASIIADGSLSVSEKAEKLALAAEQLMTPASFMYADEVASVALSFDPTNERAKFIRALIGPTMNSKGILTRIKPIMTRNEKGQSEYAQMLADSEKWPNHALKTFLFDGPEDIKTERDVQKFLGDAERKYQDLRGTLKSMRDSTFTINIPDLWQVATLKSKVKDCRAERVQEGRYEVECDLSQALQIKMNTADFDAVRHIVAGLEIYQILLNAYNYSGSISVAEQYEGTSPSAGQVYQALLMNSEFGKVRSTESLKKIVDMGLDGVAGVKWAQANQKTLCPLGKYNKNRPGFLIENGICIGPDYERVSEKDTIGTVLRTVELALRGGTIVEAIQNKRTGQEIVTEIKPAALFLNPIRDVRNLGALGFDGCNNLRSVGDATVGGVFVNGDANKVLAVTSQPCWK